MTRKRDQDIQDVMRAEKSRGRKRPRTVEEIKLKRDVQEVYRMFSDSNCTREEFLHAIQALVPTYEARVIQKLLDAWDSHHGKH
ncbi:MAG: hypothetical protein DMG05_10045 [Acidobacteria bacterium]|nr:MAG: hypothetical protein DMG05_10045 [Acidobacteriota bacterium]